MKFLYTNVILNLPPYLNYVAALPCKCTQRIVHVKPLTFYAKKHRRTVYLWHPNIPDLNPVDYKIWVIMQHRVYQTKICSVDERRVIDV